MLRKIWIFCFRFCYFVKDLYSRKKEILVTQKLNCRHRYIFKASALWADAFYKSKCPYVCVCVCSLFEVPFKRLFFPDFLKSDVHYF